MSYLFSFRGRINRAKMWLFILVTLAWEIVIGVVVALGLSWPRVVDAVRGANMGPRSLLPSGSEVFWPLTAHPMAAAALAVVALLVLAYVYALCAVYVKRLHDRNKSAWWLLLFLVIPWGTSLLDCLPAAGLWNIGEHFGPLGIGLDTARLIGGVLWLWAFIELFCLRGTVGDNRYGPDPLAGK